MAPILVDIAAASVWTGLAPGTLRRWASQGRVTRHGAPGRLLFDLHELPAADAPEAAESLRLAAAHRAARERRNAAGAAST
ncbi:hypothetical protein GCM10027294_43650 [Marinactinospora endophytica]